MEGEDIAGVGSRVVDRAIQTALDLPDAIAAVGELTGPLMVFTVRDRITGSGGAIRTIIVGLQKQEGVGWRMLRDWEMIKLLNPIADKPRSPMLGVGQRRTEQDIKELLTDAQQHLESCAEELDLPFQLPMIESLACLLPSLSKNLDTIL